MMRLRTVQGSLFKNIMESMKDNLNDCNIHCSPQGLISTGLDAAHVSLAHFKIFADGVEHYECDGNFILGINTQYFHRFLKNLNHHDLLELKYEAKDPDNLKICIKGPESGSRKVSMRLLQWEEDDLQDMPEHNYSMVLTMASGELQKVVREMIPNGDLLRITCSTLKTGDRLVTFSSSGEAGDMSYEVDLEQDGTEIEDFDEIDMEFSLKYLWSFVRASPLSPQVKIYLKQDEPVSLKYEMGSQGKHSLGETIFLLAPKMEDEEIYPTSEQAQQSVPTAAIESPVEVSATKSAKQPAIEDDLAAVYDIGQVGEWHEDDPGEEAADEMVWE